MAMGSGTRGESEPNDHRGRPTADMAQSAPLSARALMPVDAESRKILDARAELYARPRKTGGDRKRSDAFVQVGLGERGHYGIPFRHTEEIIRATRITPLPGVPAAMAGVINLRGTLLCVIDLSRLLGFEGVAAQATPWVIVVRVGGMRFGLLVSEIDGRTPFDMDDLSPPVGARRAGGKDVILGVHEGSVAILNLPAMIEDPTFAIDQGS